MQMRVMQQILAPCVQNRNEADRGAQMRGLGRNRAQGFSSGLKQHVVDQRLVLVRYRRDLLGQRKDHVEVIHGNEIGLAIFQPLRTDQRLTLRARALPFNGLSQCDGSF